MKRVFVSMAASLTTLMTSAQPVMLASNQYGDSYVDPKDVTFSDAGFTYRMISNARGEHAYSGGRIVGSIEFLYDVNCQNKKERIVRAISFTGTFAKGRVLETAEPSHLWQDISRDSVTDVLQKAICK